MATVPDFVMKKLQWLRQEQIWPNGLRYLWTDAFGVVLLVSLYQALREEQYLREAEWVVAEVERVLGRAVGIRIGEAPDRDGQYFHYLAMWLFALDRLGRVKDEYRLRGIDLARQIHHRFVVPGLGVYWKMREDLSGPYPGIGFGALDAYHGYVVYRLLAPDELAAEIAQMGDLVRANYQVLSIDQDLGLGMMLWLTHFFPQEDWALTQRQRSLVNLDRLWVEPPGYFCRYPGMPEPCSPSAIMAFLWDCRPRGSGRNGCRRCTTISPPTAPGMNTTRRRSRMSWPAPHIFLMNSFWQIPEFTRAVP